MVEREISDVARRTAESMVFTSTAASNCIAALHGGLIGGTNIFLAPRERHAFQHGDGVLALVGLDQAADLGEMRQGVFGGFLADRSPPTLVWIVEVMVSGEVLEPRDQCFYLPQNLLGG